MKIEGLLQKAEKTFSISKKIRNTGRKGKRGMKQLLGKLKEKSCEWKREEEKGR